MVIEPAAGELVFINDILQSMVNETFIDASPSTIFELGTVHDLESGALLTDKVSDGLTQLSLDLASPSEKSSNTLYFSLQPATALTGNLLLLIGGPPAPTKSLPEDLSNPMSSRTESSSKLLSWPRSRQNEPARKKKQSAKRRARSS